MFTHSKEEAKWNVHVQVMCEDDIKRLLDDISHYIMEFDV
jgi:hypothetical protein